MRAVLIAHYDQPLGWVDRLNGVRTFIYTANEAFRQYRVVRNRGNDASMYLSFIIDHYDALPDQTVFCHHHENDWTQEHSLPDIINNLNWVVAPYFSLGARCNYWTAIPYDSKPYHIAAMKRNWHILDPLPYPDELTYIAGTQFCVSADLIRKWPVTFYERCLEWVYTVQEAEWFIGRFFEYTWHYIFTGNPIEIKHQYLCKTL